MSAAEDTAGRRLGMGLSALLGADAADLTAPAPEGARNVPIEFLRPSPLQPRRHFDEKELAGLAESVRARGVVQPLLVRRSDDGGPAYEIVAGERRWRAAQAAGLREVPVVVRELSDRDCLEVALVENLQRQDLSAIEEAEAYARLVEEFGHSQGELAGVIGKSRSHIANTLRLLGLPAEVKAMVQEGRLSAGHARALLAAGDDAEALAREVFKNGLSVREVERLVQRLARRGPKRKATRDPNVEAVERQLAQRLGLPVQLTTRGRGGTLSIRFSDAEQLEDLIRRLS